MLDGRFAGGPPAGPGAVHHAQQWFRFAAHSVAIRPTSDGLFRRAINGTINAGGEAVRHMEFLGYDAEGSEVRYDYSYGFIDLEVILRRWPPSPRSTVLQGILLSKVMEVGISPRMPELVQLAIKLLDHPASDLGASLKRLADECRAKLSR
jgi:hypothetical protein